MDSSLEFITTVRPNQSLNLSTIDVLDWIILSCRELSYTL